MKIFIILTIISILGGAAYGYSTPVSKLSHNRPVPVVHAASPSEAPTPTPTQSPSRIISRISEVWANEPKEDIVTAIKIANCESGFNILAKNKTSTASGIFQFINHTWVRVRNHMGENADLSLKLDAEENIKTAYALYTLRKERGLNPWTEWECVKYI